MQVGSSLTKAVKEAKRNPCMALAGKDYHGDGAAAASLQSCTFSQALSAPGQHLTWPSSTAPSPFLYQCRNNRSACSDGLPEWKRHHHFIMTRNSAKEREKRLCIYHYYGISEKVDLSKIRHRHDLRKNIHTDPSSYNINYPWNVSSIAYTSKLQKRVLGSLFKIHLWGLSYSLNSNHFNSVQPIFSHSRIIVLARHGIWEAEA